MAYATITEANEYFATRLYSDAWDNANATDRTKALEMASRDIDRLNFAGYKHTAWLLYDADACPCESALRDAEASQEAQFPRGQDTDVPNDIKIACMEIALARLDGVDPDQELQNLGVISEGFASVRTTYDRDWSLDHIRAGIASATAWRFLKPYIRSPLDFVIKRVN